MPNYVRGEGNPKAKLMFVGEAPGKDEDKFQRPFVGKSGELYDEFLKNCGLHRGEVWTTNVVKYRPPFNDMRRLSEIGVDYEDQVQKLYREVESIRPNCIVALGNTALRALTGHDGITKWRGSILEVLGGRGKCVPTFHPANFLYGDDERESGRTFKYSNKYVMQLDILRAKNQSFFPELRLPSRTLEVAHNSIDVWRFLDTYKDRDKYWRVSIDIEAIKCIPVCIGLAFNSYHAMSIPLLNVMAWKGEVGIPSNDLAAIWKMLLELFMDKRLKTIGQNFKYDEEKINTACRFPLPELYADTSILSHCLYPEYAANLAFLASIMTEEPYYKDEGKDFNLKKDSFDRLFLYNARDAAVTFEICEEFDKEMDEIKVPGFSNWRQEYVYDYMMRLHRLYMDVETTGLLVDFPARDRLIKKYEAEWDRKQAILNKLAGWEVNVGSPKQVKTLLYEQLKLPRRRSYKRTEDEGTEKNDPFKGLSADEDTIVALLATQAVTRRKDFEVINLICSLILDIRRIRKTIGTYLKAEPDYDGRMRTAIRITGTETGRSSNSIMKPPLRPTKVGLAFQTLTKHGEIGAEIRSIFVPDPGCVFVEVDLSQAEARIVALLSRDNALLEKFQRGDDVHSETTSWIFQRTWNGKKAPSDERFLGKVSRHAGNYEIGPYEFQRTVNSDARRFKIPVNISRYRAEMILKIFHQRTPKVRSVFHSDVQLALAEDRLLINPYGRRRQFFERWGDGLFKEAYAHIPQSTVADHMKQAMLRIKDRIPDIRYCMEAHDSFTSIVPWRDLEAHCKIYKEELERVIDFKYCTLPRGTLIIPAEFKVGTRNLKDLEDYKVAA